jgi:DNA-binding transcriptional ArsR family regulator
MIDDAPSSADLDEVLGAIADRERRFTLYYLRERESMPVERLAEVVATWLAVEDGTAPAKVEERDDLLRALRRTHLPTLDAVGLVEYDRETGTVTLVPPCEVVDPLLETVASLEHATRVPPSAEAAGARNDPLL